MNTGDSRAGSPLKRPIAIIAAAVVVSIVFLGGRSTDTPAPPLLRSHDTPAPDAFPSQAMNNERPSLGILDMQAAPFPAEKYTISNRWQGMSPNRDRLTQVFAGASATDSGQGLVVLMVTDWPPLGAATQTTAVFDTPGQHGAVAVDSVRERVLHLVAEDGTRYTFNLDQRAWMPV